MGGWFGGNNNTDKIKVKSSNAASIIIMTLLPF
jgi:hypothetical protein